MIRAPWRAALVASCIAWGSLPAQGQVPKTVMVEGVGAMEATTISASVQAVDQKNRVVTLKGPRGNVFAVPVSERVKNLPQVKPGDSVELAYLEAVAVDIKKSDGKPKLTEAVAAAKAKEGELPAGVALRKVQLVTNVLGINTESQSVLVRGPLGHLAEVKVRDPNVLKGLTSGGEIDLTYIEGLALDVRPGKGR